MEYTKLPSSSKAIFFKNFRTIFFQKQKKKEHDARIAWHEQNPATKLGKIRHLYKRMSKFQKEIDFSRTRYSVGFSKVAARWLSIVQREIASLEEQKGKPLPNPFITGYPHPAEGGRDVCRPKGYYQED